MRQSVAALRESLRTAREAHGWSREQLARVASRHSDEPITYEQITNLEIRYQRLPPPDILEPVCYALELDVLEVLRRVGYLSHPRPDHE